MLDDEGLTEQERLFCLYYVKYFKGKQACTESWVCKEKYA
ncbi:terminase small subunit [Bacillus thuringiensis]|nr:terminase small subunit [Bacillus thuringiensis]